VLLVDVDGLAEFANFDVLVDHVGLLDAAGADYHSGYILSPEGPHVASCGEASWLCV
jgi:hypothetical protein